MTLIAYRSMTGLFVLGSICCGVYFALNADAIATRITLLDPLSMTDIMFASLLIILCLEVCRRTVGLLLTGIVISFMIITCTVVLPAPFGHRYIGFEHFLDIMMFTTDGLFGTPLRVAATYVCYSSCLGHSWRTRVEVSFLITSRLSRGREGRGPGENRGGVFRSLWDHFGQPDIGRGDHRLNHDPDDEKIGYPATVAGAVEVAASTGGSILPPVMGSAAFIMAEYTGISYLDIVVASTIPALLYYFSVYSQVHYTSVRLGSEGSRQKRGTASVTDNEKRWVILGAVGCDCLGPVRGYSPTFVALFGAVAVIAISFFRKQTRLSVDGIVETLAETGRRLAPVVGACTAAGL